MREVSWDEMANAAGSAYTIQLEGGSIPGTLDCVEQLPPSGRASGSFRLEFLGPTDPILPQAIYPFTGENCEPFEIFIVPIERDSAGTRYEATFF